MVAMPAYQAEDDSWIASGRCRWRRDGDEFAFIWPDVGVGIGLENFRESSSGELHAEITVQYLHAGPNTHVHWARLNLLSTTSRTSLANALAKREKDLPWSEFLEVACVITGREWRRGEPVLDLAEHVPGERPRDLISGFLPYGQPSILYARGGSGKSMVAIGVCAAVMTGLPLANGITPLAQGPVLYLDYEADSDEQHQRVSAVLKGMGRRQIPPGLFLYRNQRRPIAEDARRIGADIARLGVKLVVIDSLVPALDGPAIEDGPMQRLMNATRGWGGVTVLIVAHVNKAEATTEQKGPKSIYGNMFAEYLARSTWEVRKSGDVGENDGMAVGLFNRKSNRAPKKPVGLRIRMEGGDPDWPDVIRFEGWSVDGDDSLTGAQSLGARIIKALARMGKADNETLAKELGADAETVGASARKLTQKVINLNAGKVGRGNRALWALRADVDEAPE